MLEHDAEAQERLEPAVRDDIDRLPLRNQALTLEEILEMVVKHYLFA